MKHENKLKEYETVWTCDFCGKEFETKKESDYHEIKCIQSPKNSIFPYNNKPRLSWLFLWITTILSFLTVVIILTKMPSYQTNNYLSNFLIALFLTNIGIGIFSFLAIFAKHKFKNNQVSMFTKYIFIICLIYFLINSTPFVFANYLGRNQELKGDYLKYLPTIIPTTISHPTTTSKKIIKPTSAPIDTDPVVNCTMHSNCGGGTRKIKQSECNNGICCQIGSSWIFYTSKQKCDEDQDKYNSSGSYNYSSSTNPTPTSIPVSTNVAPTAIPTTYQQPTPTINQTAINTANEERISQCQGDCRRTGSSNETTIQNYYRSQGGLGSSAYYNAIAGNNTWIQNCVDSCH